MEKNLNIVLLLDFYGEILTQKQHEVIELYYDDDLSLAEIAAHAGITRQGVRDAIKRGEHTLLFMEGKLHLAKRFHNTQVALDQIDCAAKEIMKQCQSPCATKKIGALAQRIQNITHSLREE
ncbi:MAG TPA: DNA-binding protein [Ruminococcaceae bacterium]|nr:DNA-binding protein [Oscillospiraceae bacterium]